MRRYYSHFTFIYPDIYLKNHVVELDSKNRIVKCFPFEKEIEKTEFYSGLLVFVPENTVVDIELLNKAKGQSRSGLAITYSKTIYNIFSIDGDLLSTRIL